MTSHEVPRRPTEDGFGYLLVHFIEAPDSHGEKVYFSLSDGDEPRSWRRLNRGAPVLESALGTTGIRDPFIVQGDNEYFIIGTDLRVFGGNDAGWEGWTRRGSRNIVVWQSSNLLDWSAPWTLEVAPPEAGMAWAPEAVFDATRGEFLLFWSSTLFEQNDTDHSAETYSRVLAAWTPDFRVIGKPQVMIDYGVDVIDTTILVHQGKVHRVSKEDSGRQGSRRVFHEVGSAYLADDFTLVEERIADGDYSQAEGPLIFEDKRRGRWYLFLDQFEQDPQGYIALSTTDLDAGWTPLPPDQFRMPPNTKHGSVLPLTRRQWEQLFSRFPPDPNTPH